MACGFLNVLKPKGCTSSDVVTFLKHRLCLTKVGHSGTLDPMATGVLQIAVGRATRLIRFLPTSKAYRGTIRFGIRTDTEDITGTVIETHSGNFDNITKDTVATHLAQFTGSIQQTPPIFSAIHIEGRRAYQLAREEPGDLPALHDKLPTRTVQLHSASVLEFRPNSPNSPTPEADVLIDCSAGFYVRSLARDLGNALGVFGTLSSLHRTRCGAMSDSDPHLLDPLELGFNSPLKQIRTRKRSGIPPVDNVAQVVERHIVPVKPALQNLPEVSLPEKQVGMFLHGQNISWQSVAKQHTALVEDGSHVLVCSLDREVLGVAELKSRRLVPTVVLNSR